MKSVMVQDAAVKQLLFYLIQVMAPRNLADIDDDVFYGLAWITGLRETLNWMVKSDLLTVESGRYSITEEGKRHYERL